MDMFYVTIEQQIRDDGSFGFLHQDFRESQEITTESGKVITVGPQELAESKLHAILSAAAISGIPYHSGHLYRSDGLLIEGKVYDRRQAAAAE